MIARASKLIGKLKGEPFCLDENIPSLYLIRFFLMKLVSLLWGMFRLKRVGLIFIHPSATIKCPRKIRPGKNFSVGQRCYIDALSIDGLVCGKNVSMGYCTHIELTGSLKCLGKGITIGNNVGLGSHGHYGGGGGLEIGDDTIIGNYVSFHPENHCCADLNTAIRLQGVTGRGIKVGRNCWIGAKATFLDGSEIGDGCIVAAGAVVKGKFLDNVLIGGVPAKVLKTRING